MFGVVTRVIVLCEAVRARLIAHGCPAEKLCVWNLPAGVEQYPYRPRSPIDGRTRFLVAARFVGKKGHVYLLEALDALRREGRDVSLTMIGYGPLKDQILESVDRRRLGDCVTLVDTNLASDFSETYRRALDSHDIFVLPSTTSATGDDEAGPALTMVCAQAAGLPIISTPFAGAERSMIDGITGLVCRQDEAASLTERMRWLAEHREVWNVLGKAGSDHVRAHFSLEGQMAELLGTYRAVVEEAHGPRH